MANDWQAYMFGSSKPLVKGDRIPGVGGMVFDYVTDDGKIVVLGVPHEWAPRQLDISIRRPAGTIDITPTWVAILPVYIEALTNGTPKAQAIARAELLNMAKLADDRNARLKAVP